MAFRNRVLRAKEVWKQEGFFSLTKKTIGFLQKKMSAEKSCPTSQARQPFSGVLIKGGLSKSQTPEGKPVHQNMQLNTEPWLISFSERFTRLKINQNIHRAVYIAEKPNASTFRYRVYNVFQALEKDEEWAVSFFFEDELQAITEALPHIHILIFSRVRWSFPIDHFLNQAKKHALITVFDIDDLVFNIEKLPHIIKTVGNVFQSSDPYKDWFSEISRYWLMGHKCDMTISTNVFLAKILENTFQKPSHVINNFLNKEQISISQSLFEKKMQNRTNDKFVMGYFSGTPSHQNDFNTIAPELKKFLDDHPQAQLHIVGYLDAPKILQNNLENNQIFRTPFVDFLSLQSKIASVDVNLVPLVENEFTNCKSELKFFEAAIVGTITCATPSFVYQENIRHEKTGFLCKQGEWYANLDKIYRKEIDPELKSYARDYCLGKYSPELQKKKIKTILEGIHTNKLRVENSDTGINQNN